MCYHVRPPPILSYPQLKELPRCAEALFGLAQGHSSKVDCLCLCSFNIPDDDGWEDKDVYVYYQLDNFYQNHRQAEPS